MTASICYRRLLGRVISSSRNGACSSSCDRRWLSTEELKIQPSLNEKLRDKVIFEPFSAKYRNEAMKLLLTSFKRDEPMTGSMEVELTDAHAEPVFENLFIKPALEDNASIVALDPRTRRLIGVYVSSIHRRSRAAEETYELSDASNPMVIIMDFLDIVGSGIWELLPTDVEKFVKNDIASVLEEYRCLKLGGVMKEMSIEMARRQGCTYAVAIPTAKQSQRMNERLDFQLLRFINYADYRVLGRRPFANIKPPHVRAQLMAKRIV